MYTRVHSMADVPSGVLFYNFRVHTSAPPPLDGPRLQDDPLPVHASDGVMLGQVDQVDGGTVSGWACIPGVDSAPLQVTMYVDGVEVGKVEASLEMPHASIRRLCQVDMVVTSKVGL